MSLTDIYYSAYLRINLHSQTLTGSKLFDLGATGLIKLMVNLQFNWKLQN